MSDKKTIEEKVFKLADLFLSAMPDKHLIRWSPVEYGELVTDEHRLFCWNEIVDVYKMFPAEEIEDLYEAHVERGVSMEEDVLTQLELEEALLSAVEANGGVILSLSKKETQVFDRPTDKQDSRLARLTRPEYMN